MISSASREARRESRLQNSNKHLLGKRAAVDCARSAGANRLVSRHVSHKGYGSHATFHFALDHCGGSGLGHDHCDGLQEQHAWHELDELGQEELAHLPGLKAQLQPRDSFVHSHAKPHGYGGGQQRFRRNDRLDIERRVRRFCISDDTNWRDSRRVIAGRL